MSSNFKQDYMNSVRIAGASHLMKYKIKDLTSIDKEIKKICTKEDKIETEKIKINNKYIAQCSKYKQEMKYLKSKKDYYQNKFNKLITQMEDTLRPKHKEESEPPAKKQMAEV
jgi:hypothetical protein